MAAAELDPSLEFEQRLTSALQERRPADAIDLAEPQTWHANSADLWNNLAASYLCAGWIDLAEAGFRSGLGHSEAHPHCINNLLNLLISRQLVFAAQRVLEHAIQKEPANEEWKTRLADLQKKYPARSVTIYVPVHNGEATLERCLNGLNSQTYPVREVVVVNALSTDRSCEIATKCGARLLHEKEKAGLSPSCRLALSECTSDFMMKVDSDVELDPTWLERVMAKLQDESVGAAGGKLLEHRTATIADQWRRVFLSLHKGVQPVVNPDWLAGADVVYRVSALKKVNPWDARYPVHAYEDVEVSLGLIKGGYKLLYEPTATAHHLRRDRMSHIMQTAYNYWHLPDLLNGPAYRTLASATALLEVNQKSSIGVLKRCLDNGWPEITYPCFLIYFWWCLRDLQEIRRRGEATEDAYRQTAIATFVLMRHKLRNASLLPPELVTRTLKDVRPMLPPALAEADRDLLASDKRMDELAPPSNVTIEALLPAIHACFSQANISYLQAFYGHGYLNSIGPGVGVPLGLSAQAATATEEEHGDGDVSRPACVLFNPPLRKANQQGDIPGEASLRWFDTAPVLALADRLRSEGNRVLVLDAVALRLDEQEAEERVRGLDPVAVIYNAAESGFERIRHSARRMKLLSSHSLFPDPRLASPRCILVGAGNSIPPTDYPKYPMFDRIYPSIPPTDELVVP